MASIPFGLSVHHFISSVGADAGFASLIGLALLVLLYFAHARETATLRSRADEAGLRVQELETQLADLADQVAALPAEILVRAASPRAAAASAGSPERVAGGVGASAAGRGGSFPPSAPAGVAAPALAAATRMIPLPEFRVAEPEPQPATVAGGSNGSGHVPVAASAATVQRPVQAPVGRGPAGPGRAGGAPTRPGVGPAARRGAGQPRPVAGQPRPVAGQPRGGTGRPVMPMRPASRRSRTRRTLAVVAVVAVGAAAVAAAVLLLSNHGSSQAANRSSVSSSLASHRTARTSAAAAVRPSTVTVSVLNGTDITGLAGRVSQRLATAGYRTGTPKDASDQTHTTSIVSYMTAADRPDALAVASSLKLHTTSVQPIDPSTKQVACPPSQTCAAAVVVTAGQDLAAQ